MNIWLVQTGEPIPLTSEVKKMRTGLLADQLVQNGHQVLWWTSAFDHFKKDWIKTEDCQVRLDNGLNLFFLKGSGYKRNISLARFVDHRHVTDKFNTFANKMPKPDCIITAMPPHDIANAAVRFARENDIPVFVDVRDPWPDIFIEHIPSFLKKVARFVLNKEFKMSEETMKNADVLLAATQNFLDWALNYAQRKQKETDLVLPLGYRRQKISDVQGIQNKFSDLLEKTRGKFIVFFMGTISNSYHNPSILVDAANALKDKQDIHFIIAGDGQNFKDLQKYARESTNVTLTGWLNREEIEFWLSKVHIGACPLARSIDLPTNKAYAYLSAGLPLVSAFPGELKTLIETKSVGLYYPAGDLHTLVQNIEILYSDRVCYETMRKHAFEVFEELYDAEKIYQKYASYIESYCGKRNGTKK